MRIVVPFVEGKLHPSTVHALETYAPGFQLHQTVPAPFSSAEFVDLTEDAQLGYGRLIQRLWRDGEDVCVIEQDIEIGPATLYDFRACDHQYCGNPFHWVTNVGVAMGCTRFRAEFIAAHPSAVDEALAIAPGFRQFDVIFQRRILAKKYGAQPHVHSPVIHHNKPLRAGASPVPLEGVPVDDIGNVFQEVTQ